MLTLRGLQLDVHRRVLAQAVDERNHDAVRDRVLAGQEAACVGRLFTFQNPGVALM